MLVFTWNVQGKAANLNRALQYLADLDTEFIASFQEVRESLPEFRVRVGQHGAKVVASRTSTRKPYNSLVLLARRGTRKANGKGWPAQRAVPAQVTLGDEAFWVLGFHGHPLTHVPLGSHDRTVWARNYRRFIREVTGGVNEKLILLGDFNAEPHTQEISTVAGLWAVTSKSELDLRAVEPDGTGSITIKPYYNATREAPTTTVQGTHRYSRAGNDPWKILDQIIVSEDVSGRVSNVRILTKLGDASLLNKAGNPGMSDHLPVELSIL